MFISPPHNPSPDVLDDCTLSDFINLPEEEAFTCDTRTSVEHHEFRTILCMHCHHEISVPVYCGNRFCPICSRSRLRKIRDRLDHIIKHIKPIAGYSLKHLTLTIRNQSELSSMIKHLVHSFRKLRQRAWWKNNVDGGAYVVEITGRPGNWHAHIHSLVFSRYLSYDTLKANWQAVSGGIGCYIQRIPAGAAIGYLTKYLTKDPDMPEVVSAEINKSIKGMRWFSPYGSWYALSNTYVHVKRGCPECGASSWILLDAALNPDRFPALFEGYIKAKGYA